MYITPTPSAERTNHDTSVLIPRQKRCRRGASGDGYESVGLHSSTSDRSGASLLLLVQYRILDNVRVTQVGQGRGVERKEG